MSAHIVQRLRIFVVVVLSFGLASVAVAALLPVRFDSREERFEIPKGTWARRMAGDKVEILPSKIYLASALVALLSAGITARMLRHSTLAPHVRLFWIIGNALSGFAGLLSFLFGYYWKRGDFLSAQPGRAASADANATESHPLGYNH